MNLKLSDVLDAIPALQHLSVQKLPIKGSYKVAKVLTKVKAEHGLFEQERLKLCESLGTLNEKKTGYDFTDENKAKFEADLTSLREQEVTLDGIVPITLDEIKIDVEPSILAMLGPFLTD